MKDVYLPSDLASRDLLDAGADKPARLAVIGHPVKHSQSPQMHQAALDAQGHKFRYIRLEVAAGEVQQTLKRLEELDFIGVNVTVPHKLEVMQACDSLTEAATQLGAVNTVHFTSEGWIGHNTDGPGLANALQQQLGTSFSEASTLIIGAGGGAGRAIAVQAALDACPRLTLANRTVAKLEEIATTIRAIHPDCQLQCIATSEEELSAAPADLVINASSLGMQPSDPLPYPAAAMQPHQVFYDAVYSPAVTAMLNQAQQLGCRTANGHSMLVHQGALSYAMWLDQQPDLGLMAAALQ